VTNFDLVQELFAGIADGSRVLLREKGRPVAHGEMHRDSGGRPYLKNTAAASLRIYPRAITPEGKSTELSGEVQR
jgi:hypothetical protein